ncbi:MAG: electron transfer flavoprotein subunit alpha/FixB family protein [Myxococcaceae bacterium]|nr:electron transfer flavoprotein subunit alpha/FixB family protein [Myxococcaceae bacterium]MCA3015556.1 electron transfer flavoprotein subunit alpha/FixB family protein [Myxococcaceae bacterium]
MSNVLIVVEAQPDGSLRKATLNALTAGQQIAAKTGGELHAVVLAKDALPLANVVKEYGVKVVHAGSAAHLTQFTADAVAPAVAELATAIKAGFVGVAATQAGRDVMPRVAARLKAAMASEILSVVGSSASDLQFTRPMWAGAVIATVKLSTPVVCFSARTTEFPQAGKAGSGEVRAFTPAAPAKALQKVVAFKEVKSARPALTEARVVVSGGRGTKGDFKAVEALADELGAAVGASRAVCDAGWQPNDLQVGQTGKVVAPQLYIAAGISGAIQHIAGMKGSKTIVAINKDGEAPIFQVADYGLVADLFKALPELQAAVKAAK